MNEPNPDIINETFIEPDTATERLFTVTPLSKYFAMALFVVLPFVGFLLGYTYTTNNSVQLTFGTPENLPMAEIKQSDLDKSEQAKVNLAIHRESVKNKDITLCDKITGAGFGFGPRDESIFIDEMTAQEWCKRDAEYGDYVSGEFADLVVTMLGTGEDRLKLTKEATTDRSVSHHTTSLDASKYTITHNDDFDYVDVEDWSISLPFDKKTPILYYKSFNIELPQNIQILDVYIEQPIVENLGYLNIPSAIRGLGMPDDPIIKEFIPITDSFGVYPDEQVSYTVVHSNNYTLVNIVVYPYQHNVETKETQLIIRGNLVVEYTSATDLHTTF